MKLAVDPLSAPPHPSWCSPERCEDETETVHPSRYVLHRSVGTSFSGPLGRLGVQAGRDDEIEDDGELVLGDGFVELTADIRLLWSDVFLLPPHDVPGTVGLDLGKGDAARLGFALIHQAEAATHSPEWRFEGAALVCRGDGEVGVLQSRIGLSGDRLVLVRLPGEDLWSTELPGPWPGTVSLSLTPAQAAAVGQALMREAGLLPREVLDIKVAS